MQNASHAGSAKTVKTTFTPTKHVAVLTIMAAAFVGCGARSESLHTAFSQITDGTSETLLAGTVSESRSVPWTKPDDIRLGDTFHSQENSFVEGNFMFANGSIRRFPIEDGLNIAKFRAAFTISGGDTWRDFYPPGHKFAFDASPKSATLQDAIRYAQKTEKGIEVSNAIKKIFLAFHKYHEKNKHLPPAIVYGPDGKPRHSWRVLILPFLDEHLLYQQYDFSVPWDDPKNAAILDKMPQVYRDPFSENENDNRTRYLVISGPGTAFPTKNVLPPTFSYAQSPAEKKPSASTVNQDVPRKPEPVESGASEPASTSTSAVEEIKKVGGMVTPNPAGEVSSVVLAMSKVTDEGLVHLTGLKDISSLTLTSNIITDKGLVHLEGLTGLKSLILSGTNLTDAGLVHLKGLINLESLSLGGPRFTNAGVVQLKEFSKLKTLSFVMTNVTDSGLQHVKKLSQLQSLNLMGGFSDAGLAHLRELQSLQSLWLGGSKVTDDGLVHLKELTNLQFLDLHNTSLTDAGLKHLTGLKKLTSLNLQTIHMNILGIEKLRGSASPKPAESQITDDGLVHLKELTNLQTLNLGGTKVSDAGLIHLKELTNLKVLDLKNTSITDAGLTHLLGMSELKGLGLSGTTVTEEGKSKLKQAITALTFMSF